MPVFVATLICHLLNLNYEFTNTHVNVKPRERMATSTPSWAAGNYDLVQEKWQSIHKYGLPVRLWGGGGILLWYSEDGTLQLHVTFAALPLTAPKMCHFTADNTPSGVAGFPVPRSPPIGGSQKHWINEPKVLSSELWWFIQSTIPCICISVLVISCM